MTASNTNSRWSLRNRQTRLLLYVGVLLGVIAWKFVPRPWHPTLTVQTPHHTIFSTATREQTEAVAHSLELLYSAYSNRHAALPGFRANHARMQIKLYQDRAELRKINPGLSWAEAFYSKPYCHAYYSAEEINPYHWMLHESVHQLNEEVAHLRLEKWLSEGLAEYLGSSRLHPTELAVGQIDLNTYPVWWIDDLATSASLAENLTNGSVIPLRTIITNRGGPAMKDHFNLYYLHWWSLTHFIFESEAHRTSATKLLQRGGDLASFEELIGPVEKVQGEWHAYVRELKAGLSKGDSKFLLNPKKSQTKPTNAPAGGSLPAIR